MATKKKLFVYLCIWSVMAWGLVLYMFLRFSSPETENQMLQFSLLPDVVVSYALTLVLVYAVYGIGKFVTECKMEDDLSSDDVHVYRVLSDNSEAGLALLKVCYKTGFKDSENNIDKFFERHKILKLFDGRIYC